MPMLISWLLMSRALWWAHSLPTDSLDPEMISSFKLLLRRACWLLVRGRIFTTDLHGHGSIPAAKGNGLDHILLSQEVRVISHSQLPDFDIVTKDTRDHTPIGCCLTFTGPSAKPPRSQSRYPADRANEVGLAVWKHLQPDPGRGPDGQVQVIHAGSRCRCGGAPVKASSRSKATLHFRRSCRGPL